MAGKIEAYPEGTKLRRESNLETVHYEIAFANGDVTLLFDGENYRLEKTEYTKKLVDEGYFKLENEEVELQEISQKEKEINLIDVDGVGEMTAENLEEEGLDDPEKLSEARLTYLQTIDGVGMQTAKNLKEAASSG